MCTNNSSNNNDIDINHILDSIYNKFRQYYFHNAKNNIDNSNQKQFLSTMNKIIKTNILYDKVIGSDDFKKINIPIKFKKTQLDIEYELKNIYLEVFQDNKIDCDKFEKLYKLYIGK